jgi:hypothetical protein
LRTRGRSRLPSFARRAPPTTPSEAQGGTASPLTIRHILRGTSPCPWPGGCCATEGSRDQRGRRGNSSAVSVGRSQSEHPRNQVRSSHATRRRPRRQMGHARNQVGTKAAAAVAPRGAKQVGWCTKRGGAARPTDAA